MEDFAFDTIEELETIDIEDFNIEETLISGVVRLKMEQST
jgi:hypothetical protein